MDDEHDSTQLNHALGIGTEHALYRYRVAGGFCSIERDTDPTRLSPDYVTMVIAVLCVDNQVE